MLVKLNSADLCVQCGKTLRKNEYAVVREIIRVTIDDAQYSGLSYHISQFLELLYWLQSEQEFREPTSCLKKQSHEPDETVSTKR